MKYTRKIKILFIVLTVIVFIGSLTASGCTALLTPSGWSGATIDENIIFVGSGEGTLIAMDLSTGSELDTVHLESPDSDGDGSGCMAAAEPIIAVYGTPVLNDEFIYIGSYIKENNRTIGKFYAFGFDRTDLKFQGNEPRWEYPQGDEYFDGPIVGGAVITPDMVYFGCSDGKVYALNAQDGYKEWEFTTGDKVWSTPVIHNETLYIGSYDNNLYALNAANGEEIWHYESGGGIATVPLIHDDTVYFGSFDRFVYAVDTGKGELVWKSDVEAGSWFWATPIIHNGVIYSPSVDGNIYIIDIDNGELIKTVAPEITAENEELNLIRSSPALFNDLLLFATEEGKIYILDTTDYSIDELYEVDDVVYAPLVVNNGVLYVYTKEGNLIVYDIEKKMKLWDYP